MQYRDMALMTEKQGDALFFTRLFRPCAEISEVYWLGRLTILP